MVSFQFVRGITPRLRGERRALAIERRVQSAPAPEGSAAAQAEGAEASWLYPERASVITTHKKHARVLLLMQERFVERLGLTTFSRQTAVPPHQPHRGR